MGFSIVVKKSEGGTTTTPCPVPQVPTSGIFYILIYFKQGGIELEMIDDLYIPNTIFLTNMYKFQMVHTLKLLKQLNFHKL